MFIEAELTLALPFDVAREALELSVVDGGLVAESRRAMGEGLVFLMPVGPRGSHGLVREVVVRLLPGRRVGASYVIGLRWDVAGLSGPFFPALDANLELSVIDPGTRLSVVGSYKPPLGRLGVAMDRAGMSRVASGTMKAFLREVASRLEVFAAATRTATRAPGPMP